MKLDDVDALVCQRLGVVSIPPLVSKLIREKSEGIHSLRKNWHMLCAIQVCF
jgi:hypothetical protein